MHFKPGNEEYKKADHKKQRVVTQQLTSALNEAYQGGDKTKLRAVIDTWIANAINGDQAAINAIADRIDGKPAQEQTLTVRSELDRMDDGQIREFIRRELALGSGSGAETAEQPHKGITH
jgi:hypothetical protein